ncbi:dihydrofolate reductase family protein [Catenulispora yoronensis]|uniref:Dihydrofolate reductase family protein n=1 Tax=Catenulispora yoronensis TaxID=450799 RepID=A0ABP5H3R5_9ACTN
MGKVFLDMTVSLDGLVTGPDGDLSRLHDWLFTQSGDPRNAAALGAFFEAGACVAGHETFRTGEEPWGPEPPFPMPVFVLASRPRERLVKGQSTFTFVSDGIESAIRQAREAADGKDVAVMGGAATARAALAAGLLDELRLHHAPVVLGAGTPLFVPGTLERIELEELERTDGAGVVHVRYRVAGKAD